MSTKKRTIEKILTPPPPHMVGNGFRVHNFIPHGGVSQKRMSPFLMLDYNAKIEFPSSDTPRGVGVHPHKGFETVTIAYHGKIAHHDSAGNSGVISDGGVQWMTAGSGVLHKEYHDNEFSKLGGLFQIAQLWVNLPKKHKLTAPKYQDIPKENMSRYTINSNSYVEIIAGELNGIKGNADTFTPVNLFNIHLEENTVFQFDIPQQHNLALLIVEGEVDVNSSLVGTDHFVLMQNDGTTIDLCAKKNAVILVMSGEPINEPIAAYGPFVMNSTEEIYEAILEVQSDKFGKLED